jgi:cell division protein FtsB
VGVWLTFFLVLFDRGWYLGLVLAIENALFCHDPDVKKGSSTSSAGSATTRRRGRRALQYVLVFIGCVLVLDALVGEKGLLEMLKKREEYRALEQSLDDVRAENIKLREEAKWLQEDVSAIEDLARRELGLIKPGEKLFILKDVAPADSRVPK